MAPDPNSSGEPFAGKKAEGGTEQRWKKGARNRKSKNQGGL